VTDGGIRDVAGIRKLGVPVFAGSSTPRHSFGRALIAGVGEPVRCAGAEVASGDLIRAEEDGVVVVRAGHAADALAAVKEKLGLERIVREALERGQTAAEVYDYGVL
jgi:4-hydroxy-4-methyl-2-oxoglutarate aldolase